MIKLTKNIAELLKLFLTNPDHSFYMQEIGRILGKKPGYFQRTINNMEEEGILISEYKANARYFRANKSFPLYEEFKSIVFKTIGITGTLKEALKKIKGAETVFIYGSFAKSEENSESDIDLFIIGNIDEDGLVRQINKIEKTLKREINYTVYTENEFKKKKRSRDSFILDLLENPKVFLIGDENAL